MDRSTNQTGETRWFRRLLRFLSRAGRRALESSARSLTQPLANQLSYYKF